MVMNGTPQDGPTAVTIFCDSVGIHRHHFDFFWQSTRGCFGQTDSDVLSYALFRTFVKDLGMPADQLSNDTCSVLMAVTTIAVVASSAVLPKMDDNLIYNWIPGVVGRTVVAEALDLLFELVQIPRDKEVIQQRLQFVEVLYDREKLALLSSQAESGDTDGNGKKRKPQRRNSFANDDTQSAGGAVSVTAMGKELRNQLYQMLKRSKSGSSNLKGKDNIRKLANSLIGLPEEFGMVTEATRENFDWSVKTFLRLKHDRDLLGDGSDKSVDASKRMIGGVFFDLVTCCKPTVSYDDQPENKEKWKEFEEKNRKKAFQELNAKLNYKGETLRDFLNVLRPGRPGPMIEPAKRLIKHMGGVGNVLNIKLWGELVEASINDIAYLRWCVKNLAKLAKSKKLRKGKQQEMPRDVLMALLQSDLKSGAGQSTFFKAISTVLQNSRDSESLQADSLQAPMSVRWDPTGDDLEIVLQGAVGFAQADIARLREYVDRCALLPSWDKAQEGKNKGKTKRTPVWFLGSDRTKHWRGLKVVLALLNRDLDSLVRADPIYPDRKSSQGGTELGSPLKFVVDKMHGYAAPQEGKIVPSLELALEGLLRLAYRPRQRDPRPGRTLADRLCIPRPFIGALMGQLMGDDKGLSLSLRELCSTIKGLDPAIVAGCMAIGLGDIGGLDELFAKRFKLDLDVVEGLVSLTFGSASSIQASVPMLANKLRVNSDVLTSLTALAAGAVDALDELAGMLELKPQLPTIKAMCDLFAMRDPQRVATGVARLRSLHNLDISDLKMCCGLVELAKGNTMVPVRTFSQFANSEIRAAVVALVYQLFRMPSGGMLRFYTLKVSLIPKCLRPVIEHLGIVDTADIEIAVLFLCGCFYAGARGMDNGFREFAELFGGDIFEDEALDSAEFFSGQPQKAEDNVPEAIDAEPEFTTLLTKFKALYAHGSSPRSFTDLATYVMVPSSRKGGASTERPSRHFWVMQAIYEVGLALFKTTVPELAITYAENLDLLPSTRPAVEKHATESEKITAPACSVFGMKYPKHRGVSSYHHPLAQSKHACPTLFKTEPLLNFRDYLGARAEIPTMFHRLFQAGTALSAAVTTPEENLEELLDSQLQNAHQECESCRQEAELIRLEWSCLQQIANDKGNSLQHAGTAAQKSGWERVVKKQAEELAKARAEHWKRVVKGKMDDVLDEWVKTIKSGANKDDIESRTPVTGSVDPEDIEGLAPWAKLTTLEFLTHVIYKLAAVFETQGELAGIDRTLIDSAIETLDEVFRRVVGCLGKPVSLEVATAQGMPEETFQTLKDKTGRNMWRDSRQRFEPQTLPPGDFAVAMGKISAEHWKRVVKGEMDDALDDFSKWTLMVLPSARVKADKTRLGKKEFRDYVPEAEPGLITKESLKNMLDVPSDAHFAQYCPKIDIEPIRKATDPHQQVWRLRRMGNDFAKRFCNDCKTEICKGEGRPIYGSAEGPSALMKEWGKRMMDGIRTNIKYSLKATIRDQQSSYKAKVAGDKAEIKDNGIRDFIRRGDTALGEAVSLEPTAASDMEVLLNLTTHAVDASPGFATVLLPLINNDSPPSDDGRHHPSASPISTGSYTLNAYQKLGLPDAGYMVSLVDVASRSVDGGMETAEQMAPLLNKLGVRSEAKQQTIHELTRLAMGDTLPLRQSGPQYAAQLQVPLHHIHVLTCGAILEDLHRGTKDCFPAYVTDALAHFNTDLKATADAQHANSSRTDEESIKLYGEIICAAAGNHTALARLAARSSMYERDSSPGKDISTNVDQNAGAEEAKPTPMELVVAVVVRAATKEHTRLLAETLTTHPWQKEIGPEPKKQVVIKIADLIMQLLAGLRPDDKVCEATEQALGLVGPLADKKLNDNDMLEQRPSIINTLFVSIGVLNGTDNVARFMFPEEAKRSQGQRPPFKLYGQDLEARPVSDNNGTPTISPVQAKAVQDEVRRIVEVAVPCVTAQFEAQAIAELTWVLLEKDNGDNPPDKVDVDNSDGAGASRVQLMRECVKRLGRDSHGNPKGEDEKAALECAQMIACGRYSALFGETGLGERLVQPSKRASNLDEHAVRKLLLAMVASISEGNANDLATRAMQNEALKASPKKALAFFLKLDEEEGKEAVKYEAEIPPSAGISGGAPAEDDPFKRNWHKFCCGESSQVRPAGIAAGLASCVCPAPCNAARHDLRPKLGHPDQVTGIRLPLVRTVVQRKPTNKQHGERPEMCESCYEDASMQSPLLYSQSCGIKMCLRCDRYWHSFSMLAPHPLHLPLDSCAGRTVLIPYSTGPEMNWRQVLNVQQDGAAAALVVRKPMPRSLARIARKGPSDPVVPLDPSDPKYYEAQDAQVKLWHVGSEPRSQQLNAPPWGWDVTPTTEFRRGLTYVDPELPTNEAELYRFKRQPAPYQPELQQMPVLADSINENDAFVLVTFADRTESNPAAGFVDGERRRALVLYELRRLSLGSGNHPRLDSTGEHYVLNANKSDVKKKMAAALEQDMAAVLEQVMPNAKEEEIKEMVIKEIGTIIDRLCEAIDKETGKRILSSTGWMKDSPLRLLRRVADAKEPKKIFCWKGKDSSEQERNAAEAYASKIKLRAGIKLPIISITQGKKSDQERTFWNHMGTDDVPQSIAGQVIGSVAHVVAVQSPGARVPTLYVWQPAGGACSHGALRNAVGFAKRYAKFISPVAPPAPLRVLEGSEPDAFPEFSSDGVFHERPWNGEVVQVHKKHTDAKLARPSKKSWPYRDPYSRTDGPPVEIPTLILLEPKPKPGGKPPEPATLIDNIYKQLRAKFKSELLKPGKIAPPAPAWTFYMYEHGKLELSARASTELTSVFPCKSSITNTLDYLGAIKKGDDTWVDWVIPPEVLEAIKKKPGFEWLDKDVLDDLVSTFLDAFAGKGKMLTPKSLIDVLWKCRKALGERMATTIDTLKKMISAIDDTKANAMQKAILPTTPVAEPQFYDLGIQGNEFEHGVNGPKKQTQKSRMIRKQIENGLKKDESNSEFPRTQEDLVRADLVLSSGIILIVIAAFENFDALFTLQRSKQVELDKQKKEIYLAAKEEAKQMRDKVPGVVLELMGVDGKDGFRVTTEGVVKLVEPPKAKSVDDIARDVASTLSRGIVASISRQLQQKIALLVTEQSDTSKRQQFVWDPADFAVWENDERKRDKKPSVDRSLDTPWKSLEVIMLKLTETYAWHFGTDMLYELWKGRRLPPGLANPFQALTAAGSKELKRIGIAVDMLQALHGTIGDSTADMSEAGTRVAVALGIFAGLDQSFVRGVLLLARGKLDASNAKELAPFIINAAESTGAAEAAGTAPGDAASIDNEANAELIGALIGLIQGDVTAATPLARKFGGFDDEKVIELIKAITTAQSFLNTGKKKAKKISNKISFDDDEKPDPAKLFQKADVDKSGKISFDEYYDLIKMLNYPRKVSECRAMKLFVDADRDGDNELTSLEFEEALDKFDEETGNDVLDRYPPRPPRRVQCHACARRDKLIYKVDPLFGCGHGHDALKRLSAVRCVRMCGTQAWAFERQDLRRGRNADGAVAACVYVHILWDSRFCHTWGVRVVHQLAAAGAVWCRGRQRDWRR